MVLAQLDRAAVDVVVNDPLVARLGRALCQVPDPLGAERLENRCLTRELTDERAENGLLVGVNVALSARVGTADATIRLLRDRLGTAVAWAICLGLGDVALLAVLVVAWAHRGGW